MLSASQFDYAQSMAVTMRREGYDYYVVYAISDNTGSRRQPDLCLVFSREKIMANGLYSYSVPEGAIRYDVITVGYSSYYDDGTARVSSVPFSGTLTIKPYEHLYTNAEASEGTLQPDLMPEEVKTNESIQAFGIVVTVALLVSLFLSFFRH